MRFESNYMVKESPAQYEKDDTIIQKYKVLEVIESGNQSLLYHCIDLDKHREVAIKSIPPQMALNEDIISLFYSEAETLIRLQGNANVVKLYIVEDIDSYPFIVMEWIKGHEKYGNTLGSWLSRYSFTLKELLEVCLQVCMGYIYCIEQFNKEMKQFVHRDIKPENILMTENGIAKLTDFGMCSYTPKYAAKEVKDSNGASCYEWSDVYSFGVVMDEMLKKLSSESSDFALEAFHSIIDNCYRDDIEGRLTSFLFVYEALEKVYEQYVGPYTGIKNERRIQLSQVIDRNYSLRNIGKDVESGRVVGKELLHRYSDIFVDIDVDGFIIAVGGGSSKYRFNDAEYERKHRLYASALQSYSGCIDNSYYIYRWGTLLQQLGYISPAISKYIRALQMDKKMTNALSKLIDSYLYMYNAVNRVPSLFIKTILLSFDCPAEDILWYKMQGALCQLDGDVLSSTDYYKKYLNHKKMDLSLKYQLLRCLFESKNYDESIDVGYGLIAEINLGNSNSENYYLNSLLANTHNYVSLSLAQLNQEFQKHYSGQVAFGDVNFMPIRHKAAISPILRETLIKQGMNDDQISVQMVQEQKKYDDEFAKASSCPIEVSHLIKLAKGGSKEAEEVLTLINQGQPDVCNLLSFVPSVGENIFKYLEDVT